MKKDLWQRAEEIFHAALERPPETRRAFLDEACGNDAELRQQVEMLVSKDAGEIGSPKFLSLSRRRGGSRISGGNCISPAMRQMEEQRKTGTGSAYAGFACLSHRPAVFILLDSRQHQSLDLSGLKTIRNPVRLFSKKMLYRLMK